MDMQPLHMIKMRSDIIIVIILTAVIVPMCTSQSGERPTPVRKKVLFRPSYQSRWIALCSDIAFVLTYGNIACIHHVLTREVAVIVYSHPGCGYTSVPNSKWPNDIRAQFVMQFRFICVFNDH